MAKISGFQYLTFGLIGTVMIVAFNNCGEGFMAERMGGGGGGGSFFSRAPGQSCEDALLGIYRSSYHPFLSQTCVNCHVNGPGIGAFASADAKTSYTSFSSIGAAKIASQAVSEFHNPPYTGSANTARVNEINGTWARAQSGYAACLAEGGGTGAAGAVKSTAKAIPSGLGTTNFVRIEWDLENLSNTKVPLVAGIEMRLGAVSGVTRGYEYRNPTLRLKSAASGSYRVRALNIYVNDQLQSDVTTYSNVDMTIAGVTDVNLAAGSANAFNTRAISAGDTISLEFQSLISNVVAPTPTPTPVATPTPVPGGGGSAVKTFTQLNMDGGQFRTYCTSCHNPGNAKGSLDLTNYAQAKASAVFIRNRVNNSQNPMPTGGLILSEERDVINAWVDAGAPQ